MELQVVSIYTEKKYLAISMISIYEENSNIQEIIVRQLLYLIAIFAVISL